MMTESEIADAAEIAHAELAATRAVKQGIAAPPWAVATLRKAADWRSVAVQDSAGQARLRAAQAMLAALRVGHSADCPGCLSGYHAQRVRGYWTGSAS